jgi:hypothetical protein
MSKIFNKTSTDDTWNQNIGLDSIASQSLGILIPNTTLTYAAASYEAGQMAWRIQNSNDLRVKARGLGNKAGLDCYASQQMPPITVSPTDIVSFYPLAEPLAGQTNTLAWIQTSKGVELFKATGAVSNVDAELKSAVQNQTLGDAFFGSVVQRIWVQVSDTDSCNYVALVDEMGGTVATFEGGVRGATGGSKSNQYNLYVTNIAIPIGKGWTLKVNNTASA